MRLDDLKFDFMSYRKIAAVVSATLVVLAFSNLAINQVEWGLDFTGGTLVEVFYEQSVDPEQIRIDLDDAGYEGHVVQYFGSDQDVLVRVPPHEPGWLAARVHALSVHSPRLHSRIRFIFSQCLASSGAQNFVAAPTRGG